LRPGFETWISVRFILESDGGYSKGESLGLAPNYVLYASKLSQIQTPLRWR
jgi:hypothetical protein